MNHYAWPDRLIVTPHMITGNWRLVRDFRYSLLPSTTITVPAGFVTDFASVPKIFRSIYESWGGYGFAAVIHDYLYDQGDRPRVECDRIYYEAMMDSGVSVITARLLWISVRAFGWYRWRRRHG